MKVPFLDLKKQYDSIKNEIQKEINEVLDNTAYICDKKVKDFEDSFSKLHNAKYCLGLSSGTDALHLAYWTLGIGISSQVETGKLREEMDEVIVPVNTYIATTETITMVGAKPVFVDHEEESFNIDPKKIEEKITARTKAIVVVHLYGQPADMDPVIEIAKKHNLILIEDCSQAHLAEYLSRELEGENNVEKTYQDNNSNSREKDNPGIISRDRWRKVGTFGKVATFSFYPGKNLGAYGEAGAVLTDDQTLYEKMLRYRQHGAVVRYVHDIEGHNYRMEEIQGAVLGVKLKYLEKWTKERRRVARLYRELLGGIVQVKLPLEMPYAKHVYHLFVVRVQRREALMKYLKEKGVDTGLHYPEPLHIQQAYKYRNYKIGDFPIAEKCSKEILSLPLYPEMNEEQIRYVVESIKEFYQ